MKWSTKNPLIQIMMMIVVIVIFFWILQQFDDSPKRSAGTLQLSERSPMIVDDSPKRSAGTLQLSERSPTIVHVGRLQGSLAVEGFTALPSGVSPPNITIPGSNIALTQTQNQSRSQGQRSTEPKYTQNLCGFVVNNYDTVKRFRIDVDSLSSFIQEGEQRNDWDSEDEADKNRRINNLNNRYNNVIKPIELRYNEIQNINTKAYNHELDQIKKLDDMIKSIQQIITSMDKNPPPSQLS